MAHPSRRGTLRKYVLGAAFLLVVAWLVQPGPPMRTPMPVSVGNSTIALDRTSTHFFLAEYDLELVLFRDDKKVMTIPWGADTGGYSHYDVYQVGEDSLVLVGAFGASRVDLTDGSRTYLGRTNSFKPVGTFLGAFDDVGEGPDREYRFILASERPDVRVEPAKGG